MMNGECVNLNMQETWKIKLGKPISNDEIAQKLPELLERHRKDLGIFLSYYFRKQGAVAEDVKLHTTILPHDPNTGSFELDFALVFFNACLNIHETAREKMAITYALEEEILTLKGEYWPERDSEDL
jgi:hypothetical protein